MKWMVALSLLPAFAFASEQCVTQFGGKCRPVCSSNERAEQGAFIDCSDKELCCVAAPAQKSPAAGSPVVLIDQMAFVPEVTEVKTGTEVVWTNKDSSIHTVTAADGSFGSPPLNQGDVFKRVFTKPGTYSFACEMHPFMSGKIVVK